MEFWNISGLVEAAGSVTSMLLTCNETIFESVLWSISSGLRWSSHSCWCEKLLTLNLCYLTTEHASDFSSWSQSCLHCSYTCRLLHSSPLTLAPRLVDPLGFLPWLVHPFLAFCLWPFSVNLMCLFFDLCRKFALCFFVDIDEHDFCSSEDPEILTQWMIFEIVFDDCRWSTFHMCLLKLRMGYLLSWLGWFANQVEAHNLWWMS